MPVIKKGVANDIEIDISLDGDPPSVTTGFTFSLYEAITNGTTGDKIGVSGDTDWTLTQVGSTIVFTGTIPQTASRLLNATKLYRVVVNKSGVIEGTKWVCSVEYP